MRKNVSVDDKLHDFCRVSPPYNFVFRLEENTMKSRNLKPFIAVACAMMVIVCAVAFGIGFDKDATPTSEPENYGFIINARAESSTADSAEILTFESKKVNKDNPMVQVDDDKDYMLHFDHLALELVGDEVLRYSVKAETGQLHFHDSASRLSEKNVKGASTEVYDYFVSGSELLDLPVDTKGTYLYWLPDAEYVRSETSLEKHFSDCLKSAEDYNKYFADVVTLTVEYKDGSTKTLCINISFDGEGYVYAGLSENTSELKFY